METNRLCHAGRPEELLLGSAQMGVAVVRLGARFPERGLPLDTEAPLLGRSTMVLEGSIDMAATSGYLNGHRDEWSTAPQRNIPAGGVPMSVARIRHLDLAGVKVPVAGHKASAAHAHTHASSAGHSGHHHGCKGSSRALESTWLVWIS